MAERISRGRLLILFTILVLTLALASRAHAAVVDWQRGASIIPASPTDFASNTFKQSVQELKNDGGNYVDLIIPYYQSSVSSTDIGPGWNTPTDASLIAAIDYIHSLGMHVQLSLYLETNDG